MTEIASTSEQSLALKLNGVTKSFGAVSVLKGIDLDVREGEFVVFVGPSGCGKSTLLRIVAGLEDADAGTIAIGGRDVTRTPPAKRGIAMVFQTYALYPHLTVRDNMALGLRQAGTSKEIVDRQIAKATAMLSLEPYLQRRPAELSGGQRQRVAIGRAIVREPMLFLFDEPLSNLDAALRVNTRLEIARLHRELGASMVYVTHDQVEAMTLADKIVVMNEGRIEQIGSPLELYHRPATLFVAGFIGSPKMNFVAAERAGLDGAVTAGIRPEHLRLDEQGRWSGRVVHCEYLGVDTNVYVECPGLGTLTVRLFSEVPGLVGETVGIGFDEDKVHRFDARGDAIRDGGKR